MSTAIATVSRFFIHTSFKFFPIGLLDELRRIKYAIQMFLGTFVSDEIEFQLIPQLVKEGDWVLDVGANVGTYTNQFSKSVGESGRVISIEPSPHTFRLLTANSSFFAHKNVTLLNLAASSQWSIAAISTPNFNNGLDDHCRAQLSEEGESQVLCATLAMLNLPKKIDLIKIDVESHEIPVIEGLKNLINKDKPLLIIEECTEGLVEMMLKFGYQCKYIKDSPNLVFYIPETHDIESIREFANAEDILTS